MIAVAVIISSEDPEHITDFPFEPWSNNNMRILNCRNKKPSLRQFWMRKRNLQHERKWVGVHVSKKKRGCMVEGENNRLIERVVENQVLN